MAETPDFLRYVLGVRPGKLAVAFGRRPFFDDKGRYAHQEWVQSVFAWPGEMRQFINAVTAELATGDAVDVYFCPYIRHAGAKGRRKGDALAPMVCHVDLDRAPADRAVWDTLNALVVRSGQDGHRHAYVPLSRPVSLSEHRALQEVLRDRLGGDDKIADNDVLRWPGSLNHKPATAPNTGEPAPVTIQPGEPTVWEPDELAGVLGVELGAVSVLPSSSQRLARRTGAEPVDRHELPDWLRKRFTDANGAEDRSDAFHGLVGACKDAELTQGQTVTVMGTWPPGVDKYGDRLADEVARCWPKLADARTFSRQTSEDGQRKRQYFNSKGGLLAATLATDIIVIGPLAEGIDDIVWSYAGGVWAPDKHAVRARAAQLLGENYRRAHGTNAEDVVRARSPRITCEPIGEVINFRNGLYYWRLDELRDHTSDVLTTVQLAVDWNPEATCPEFDAFLAEVVPADMVAAAWELIGYLMYSGNPLHKAVMLMGNGRNGKGTLLRVVVALLGDRNVTSVSLHDLVNTRFSTASLFGKIANIAGDIDGSYLENTAIFKAVTGGDMISAEHKGRDRFDYVPWAVPVFSANKVPPSADTTVGYLSRWFVVPFPHDFTGREDRTLDQRLQTKAELQGIAVKAVAALRRLMDRGDFELPESGRDARDEFARRVDQVRTWADECADVDIAHPFVPRTTLYQAYKAWANRDGHKPVKAGEFYDRLTAIPGCRPHRQAGDGTRGFLGVKVTDSAEGDRWWK